MDFFNHDASTLKSLPHRGWSRATYASYVRLYCTDRLPVGAPQTFGFRVSTTYKSMRILRAVFFTDSGIAHLTLLLRGWASPSSNRQSKLTNQPFRERGGVDTCQKHWFFRFTHLQCGNRAADHSYVVHRTTTHRMHHEPSFQQLP